MSKDEEKAGLVLIVPPHIPIQNHEAEFFGLIDACKGHNLAALRLATAGHKREIMLERGDALREIGHARDISVIIEEHPSLARDLGLDGVHLHQPDAKTLRETRKLLGGDAIIGVHAGASKHEGMVLAEIGVDYVAYGPLKDRGLDETIAPLELFEWWSQMIEVPLIAEGGLSTDEITKIRDFVDFIALGEEVFDATEPQAALLERLAIL